MEIKINSVLPKSVVIADQEYKMEIEHKTNSVIISYINGENVYIAGDGETLLDAVVSARDFCRDMGWDILEPEQ